MAKLTGLEEVKADAKYNYLKRLREEQADKEFEASKLETQVEVETTIQKVAQEVKKKGK